MTPTSVAEQERDGTFRIAFLVNEVNVDRAEALHLDLSLEVRQVIDLGFRLPPVKSILPVLGKSLYVGKRSAVGPLIGSSKLIREGSNSKFIAQNLKCLIWHIDGVR